MFILHNWGWMTFGHPLRCLSWEYYVTEVYYTLHRIKGRFNALCTVKVDRDDFHLITHI